jgi:hypothetical protein
MGMFNGRIFGIGDYNAEKVAKVVAYFKDNACGKARDIDIDGSFALAMVNAGVLRVVGKDTEFVRVNGDMYRKVEINIYECCVPVAVIVESYKYDSERVINNKKEIANWHISEAEKRLEEAKAHINSAFN